MTLVLSLFPGIGLLDMAFEEEGFCVVRGPDLLWGGDIRRLHPPAGKFDGVIGGPPCQAFSPLVHLVRASGREPRHGNMIPDFERVVAESACAWFLMENVPQAPLPAIEGYDARSFVLDNSSLCDGNGMGEAQIRKRRFSFGVRDGIATDLRRWIAYAALELPDAAATLVSVGVDNSPEAKGLADKPDGWVRDHSGAKQRTVLGGEPIANDLAWKKEHDRNYQANRRARLKSPPVTADNDSGVQYGHEHTTKARGVVARELALSAKSDGRVARWLRDGADQKAPPSARHKARSWEECCRLQGLPTDFLSEAPFTKEGKHRALGNGVPLPMGRAIARAVKRAVTP